MASRKIDTKTTKQLRVDTGLHTMLKVASAKLSVTIKELSEGYLYDGLERDGLDK